MSQLRRRLPSPAFLVACLALFVALGGSAYAVSAINGKTIKKGTIPGDRIKKNGITGTQVNESRLTTVPKAKAADTAKSATTAASATSAGTATTATTATNAANATNATNAADAAKLGGRAASEYVTSGERKTVFQKLNDGQTVEIAAAGAVAIDAKCDDVTTNNRVRLIARTSAANSFMGGDDDLSGGALPTDFLQPDTAEADRELLVNTVLAGTSEVETEIDQGLVTAPDGTTLSINSEGWALGLNAAGTKCFVAGTVSIIRP